MAKGKGSLPSPLAFVVGLGREVALFGLGKEGAWRYSGATLGQC